MPNRHWNGTMLLRRKLSLGTSGKRVRLRLLAPRPKSTGRNPPDEKSVPRMAPCSSQVGPEWTSHWRKPREVQRSTTSEAERRCFAQASAFFFVALVAKPFACDSSCRTRLDVVSAETKPETAKSLAPRVVLDTHGARMRHAS